MRRSASPFKLTFSKGKASCGKIELAVIRLGEGRTMQVEGCGKFKYPKPEDEVWRVDWNDREGKFHSTRNLTRKRAVELANSIMDTESDG